MSPSSPNSPILYDQLAAWWPLLSDPAEYADEAAFYWHVLERSRVEPLVSVLELGSGGGNNASHLKRRFHLTLVDASPGMLAVSRALNPECEHIQGDMRSVRLGREFDAVFVHDAIMYMTSRADLLRAMETARFHCRPGGVVLFVPDHTTETWKPFTDHGGSDAVDGRGLRYVEWSWDPDPTDTTILVEYAVLLREADGSVRVEHDRHIEGLFPRDVWLSTMEEAGFEDLKAISDTTAVGEDLKVFLGRV